MSDLDPLLGFSLVVLLGVTLSMMASFVFLFSGGHVRLHLPVFSFPSPLSLLGLTGVGGGMGIFLCRKLTSIIKHAAKRQRAQRYRGLATMALFATGGRTILPPEPTDRQTCELFCSPQDPWISFEWEHEPQRRAEKREALHLRQRLRALRCDDMDGFPRDDGQKKRNQINKVLLQTVISTYNG